MKRSSALEIIVPILIIGFAIGVIYIHFSNQYKVLQQQVAVQEQRLLVLEAERTKRLQFQAKIRNGLRQAFQWITKLTIGWIN